MFADLVDETIGFRVQATGVETEHLHVAVELPGHVYQDDVLGAAEGDPQLVAEVLEGGFQDVLGGFVGKAGGEGGKVERLAHRAGVLVLGGAVALCGGNGSKGRHMALNNHLPL